MTIQLGTTLRNNRLDTIETTVGTSPKLQLRSGAQPADCATADSGTLGSELTLPSDWMAAAAGGSKAKSGSWTGTGSAAITIAHFRLKDSGATTTHMQGSCGIASGDLQFDNTSLAIGQAITINTFTINEGNP